MHRTMERRQSRTNLRLVISGKSRGPSSLAARCDRHMFLNQQSPDGFTGHLMFLSQFLDAQARLCRAAGPDALLVSIFG
ncbi:hypothetical protein Spb1_20300 [Planctopirus ephydatiae]|uniref:Uncharacterized protein n=1 Tax=Planctopirus ephydatiae TaxID=2528019 RepID=A0A518GN80_9PLAN|nr:hypothetical protein Spb1_20300 [Planctopirus ephydatiae]